MNTERKTFQFDLVSPEAVVASEQAAMVLMNGEQGQFGVLAGHVPLMAAVQPGVLEIHLPSGEVKRVFVSSGFANVTERECSVLVEEAIAVEDLDANGIQAEIKALEAELAELRDEASVAEAVERIAVAQSKLRAMKA